MLGVILLVVLGLWWLHCLSEMRFATNICWLPAWPHLGLDFMGSFLAAQVWQSGGNPYLEPTGDWRGLYPYPPVALLLHIWCGWIVSFPTAYCLHLVFSTGVFAWATALSLRLRRCLRLWTPPLPLALFVILASTPVLFAFERGNCDAWILLCIIAAVFALRRHDWFADLLAGLLLAIGAWVKIYPGLTCFGLLALRRGRALAFAVLFIVLIGVVPLRATQWFLINTKISQHDRSRPLDELMQWLRQPTFTAYNRPFLAEEYEHSLTSNWPLLMGRTPLGSVPGLLAAALVVLPYGAWVSWRLRRSPGRDRVAFAFLLWLTALATFWQPVSYDYNLFYLNLAILALWTRRDSILVHGLLILFMLWWQPIRLAMDPRLLLGIKACGLVAAGACLLRRANEDVAGSAEAAPLVTRPAVG